MLIQAMTDYKSKIVIMNFEKEVHVGAYKIFQ